MSAGLVSAKVDVPDAEINLSGVKEMHTSVEVNNSCNCFHNCFPCFRKKPKADPRKIRDNRTIEIAQSALQNASNDDLTRSKHVPSTHQLPSREISTQDQFNRAKRASDEYNAIMDVHVTVVGSKTDVYAVNKLRAGDT